jgi:hypothetical protein
LAARKRRKKAPPERRRKLVPVDVKSAHSKVPCENCPYRLDAPKKLWDRSEFIDLLKNEHSEFGGLYACHKQAHLPAPERGFCAGWLLDQRERNVPSIRLRMMIATSDAALKALEDVSDGGHKLYASLEAMCRANGVRVPDRKPDRYIR